MKPRLWVFLLIIAVIWYYYESNFDKIQSIWNFIFGKAQNGMYFFGIGIVLYVLFFQKDLVASIFKSVSAIDNDPRLRTTTIRGTSGDYRTPGTRSAYKRNVSALLKKKIAASQQWKCASCNTILDETYEVDHVIALEHGGSNDPSNLRALCPHCHRKKTVEERLR